MSIWTVVITVATTICAILAVIFLIVRAELKKERKPIKRARHDGTYGKNHGITRAAEDAAREFHGWNGAGDDSGGSD